MARILGDGVPTRVERIVTLRLEGFDWNCPQYIVPRFSADELDSALHPVRSRLAELESDVTETLFQRRYPRTAAALGKGTTIIGGARAAVLRPGISLSEISLLRHRSE